MRLPEPVSGRIKLTGNIEVSPDTTIPANTHLDLNGYTVRVTPKPNAITRGLEVNAGVTVTGGKIINPGGWGLFSFKPIGGVTVGNLAIEGVSTAIKLGADGTGVTSDILLDGLTILGKDNPATLIDIGPGASQGVVMRNIRTKAKITGNNTGADGIAVEEALDAVKLSHVYVDGATGDGIDIKGAAAISACVVINAARQGFKVWGRKGVASSFTGCISLNNGFGSMCNAGVVAMDNCYFEGGRLGSPAFFWGANKDITKPDPHGRVDEYGGGGVSAVVTNCQFIRNGGVSVLLTAETGPHAPADITFIDCTFWNEGHPNLFVGPQVVLVQHAEKGKWAANFINAKYEKAPPPGLPGPVPPPADPDPPKPPVPVWNLKEAEWNALAGRMAQLEARFERVKEALK